MKASRPTAADSIVGIRRPEDTRCWLCGVPGRPERTLRSDVHVSGHLCLSCWTLQPRGRSSWSRASSALYAALRLPREWHTTGYRSGWLEAAAAELQDQADAFERSRIPPSHRQATR
ncbi:hypothetical protein AB0900_31910 [Streptomyces cellulosae]|uniref:Recombination endonuclease VII n=2 Tax=Streptomyces TaxID=1883 RepID=A0ABU3JGE0_9ACTN|nr:hypothetical protein [Streptomyces thermodiastaticus]MDT6974129.1 hypothetical protein [Streptomyces thermocarboxydus]WSB39345.1 hypothetical protein OG853_00075 [Streptomyces cellulosae]UVT13709.1 hypothetical protein AY578_33480 [Streptomyces thermocarboxydus]WSB82233.1 hypothetical protein OHA60_00075 [Streptomyces cellulosae]